MNDRPIIEAILTREGWPTYTNLPADRGGPTKGGITLAAWREYIGDPAATIEDLQAVTYVQACEFYRARYIVKPKFDAITDERLRELMIDAGVNHHPRHPSKWLQAALGVKQDGAIGPITLEAVACADPRVLYWRVLSRRVRLYGRLVSSDAELQRAKLAGFNLQAIFAAGWNNRAADFIDAAADW